MSRLPMLTTPGRPLTGSPGGGSGIPTPSSGLRRPRASLGPGASPAVKAERDPEMDQALQDVLRNRPPSSLSRFDSDTLSPGQSSPYLSASSAGGIQAPRTPGAYRPKTPSSSAVTPTSRPTSRPSLAQPRASLVASTTTPAGRRTTSNASSGVSTPYLRPESRAGGDKWVPAVGDRVRLPSHGYEGILRYLGTTHIRDGTWAGVELEGAFKGRGRNDGTVDGREYFRCAPNCGIFTLAEKLAPATSNHAGPSRPASVASHRSQASSYSASGRVTPATDRVRRGATTPSFGTRSVQARSTDNDGEVGRRTLGNSTATNAARTEAKITAGSRASKYLNMTAKQLNERGPTPTGTPTTTPKPAAKSLGSSTAATPKARPTLTASRVGRPSLGTTLTTPKAGRRTTDMMPPPPSPQLRQSVAAASSESNSAATAALEAEIFDLKRRNAELEEQVALAEQAQSERETDSLAQMEELQRQVELGKKEVGDLQTQLLTSNGSAGEIRVKVEELQEQGKKLEEELAAKTAEAAKLKSEMDLAAERAAGELEAGMEAKRAEVRVVEERAEAAELEISELKRLVDELTLAGNQIIELNESKQFNLECQIRELEEKLSKANDDLKTAQEADTSMANGNGKPRAVTAAEIDNETLTEQVKHLQSRISKLEEQLDEARSQAETDAEAWQAKYDKAGDVKKAVLDELEAARSEIKDSEAEAEANRNRITDLEDAVKENQTALEAARAEIETMRAEAATASAKLTNNNASETTIAELQSKLKDSEEKNTELESSRTTLETKVAELEAKNTELGTKVASLQEEITTLRAKEAPRGSPSLSADGFEGGSGLQRSLSVSRRSNGSIQEAEKSIMGYHHIVTEMTGEVAQLQARNADLMDEIAMLKEENKLLQEINESDGASAPDTQETARMRTKLAQQAEALKEYEREVSELETLIESKIYHEDELESRLQELERERDSLRAKVQASAGSAKPASIHSRTDSLVSNGTAGSDLRCELCEGPHDLDACPVFAGTTLDAQPDAPTATAPKSPSKKKWCNDCESDAHNTAECPMADDVF